jgi:hypothetical protein
MEPKEMWARCLVYLDKQRIDHLDRLKMMRLGSRDEFSAGSKARPYEIGSSSDTVAGLVRKS